MKLTDKRKLVLIASAVVLQLFVTISLLCYSARVKRHALKTGSVISLSCRAYDPFSPFKGRYVRLNFDQSSPQAESLDGESADCLDGRRGKKVYCRMAEGGDGLWTVAGIRCTLPGDRQEDGTKDDGVYIEAQCRGYSYDFSDAGKKVRGVQLDYAFAEYYMQIEEKYKKDYLSSLIEIKTERKRFMEELQQLKDVRVIPSEANYFMVELTGTITVKRLQERLLINHNILIKNLENKVDGKQFMRIAVRDTIDNDLLINAMKEELS